MTSHSMTRFWRKSSSEKRGATRHRFRHALAKLPYVPIPVSLRLGPGDSMHFWWSYFAGHLNEDGAFLDYWGRDSGDLRFLWRVLKPGDTFFDVGAFHGVYSVIAGKRVTKQGKVIAFEPSPRDRRRLQLHLRWNGLRFVRVEPFAVGATESETSFFQVASGDPTRKGLKPLGDKNPIGKITVKVTSLDQYVSQNGIQRVDVMKLDVEGGELEVLDGAAEMFKRIRPILISEVLDETSTVWGYPAHEIIFRLIEAGYEWFECDPNGALIPHEIRKAYPDVRNFVAVPKEKLTLVRSQCEIGQ